MSKKNTAGRFDADAVAAIDKLLDPLAKTDAPGLVIGIAHHGKVVYRRGIGMASLEQAVANTPSTRMNIGSTAKHMTSLAVMLLMEDGKLDVDAPVRQYVPELTAFSPEPTLRQLMTHTSGMRCYLDLGFLCNGMSAKPRGYALATSVRQTELNFPSGQKMLYCNGGYHLLSIVVERVSGMPFKAFLRQRLFEPLGMLDTQAPENDYEIHSGVAAQHMAVPGGGYRRGILPHEETRGDGSVISTVDDMLKWLKNLRGPHQIGSEQTWRQMLAHTRLDSGLVMKYGLGLVRAPYRGVEVIHHAGGIVGGACQMITMPSAELDIIIIANGAPASPSELADKIIDIVLSDSLGPSATTEHVATSDYAKLAGRHYRTPSGLTIGFVDVEGKLHFSLVGNYPMPLRAGDGLLRIEYEDAGVGPYHIRVTPEQAKREAPKTLELAECGHLEEAALLPETPPSPEHTGRRLVGRYHSADMEAQAQIYFEGDRLLMRNQDGFGTSVAQLVPLSEDVWQWTMQPPLFPVPGMLNVEAKDGHVTGFRLEAARTRRVLFRRLAAAT